MLRTVDLFCGAGGLSYGFELAGCNIVAALDNDPVASSTYKLRNPELPFLEDNVEKVTGNLLRSVAGPIDMIIGGPSCQGFSTHGKRDPNDPRNFLFKHFVRLVKEVRPKWVVMENVKGLLTYDRGRYRDEIHNSFEEIGYRIESRVLNAADFGVPQFRDRLFFIATNTRRSIRFPSPTHCPSDLASITGLIPHITVKDAIGDLDTIGSEGEAMRYSSRPQTPFQHFVRQNAPKILTLHRARKVSDLAMSLIKLIPQGNGIRFIAPNKLPERFRKMRTISTGALRKDCTTLYYRLSWDRPSYTITCYFTNVSSGPFVHPTENRALTPREAARLQSFPDSYYFVGKQIQRQIGNAVPPLLARAVAAEVLACASEPLSRYRSRSPSSIKEREAAA